MQRATGASRVLVFDHTIRDSTSTRPYWHRMHQGGPAAGISRVHGDFTDHTGPSKLRALRALHTNGMYQ